MNAARQKADPLHQVFALEEALASDLKPQGTLKDLVAAGQDKRCFYSATSDNNGL